MTPNVTNAILTAMELPCYFNNTQYVVPCEAEVGYRWSKNMLPVSRDSSAQDITLAMLDRMVSEHPKLQAA